MSELVTKEFLKAFGDKCKKIFKPQTTVVNAPDDNEYKYLIINTDLPWLDTWVVNIDISGKGFTNSYNSYYGDIKFFGNISNQGNWEGRGYSLVDNEVIGILVDNYPSGVEHKTSFVVQFFEPVKQVAIDIINYLGDGTSNVNINSVEFTHSLGSAFSYAYILGNVDYKPSTIGKIIRLEQQSEVEQFLFKLPKQNDDADLDGEYMNIPEDTTQVDSVNDSKWAKYIKTKHDIKLEEGDLKETIISFGGDNTTDISIPPLEINNSVQGNTEGEWFGKVQVNSKGLVTAVEKDPELPKATETTLGVVQVGYKENLIDKQYPVKLDADGNAYVHVPWNDTDTWNKVANSNDLGLIKIGYVENNKNYPVQLDSDNRAYVNVPWEDTTYSIATNDVAGLIKIGGEETDCKKPVILDDGVAYVSVKPSQSNMTFSATDNSNYSGPIIDYTESQFFTINIGDTFEKRAATLGIKESSALKEGIKTIVVRIINNKTISVPFIISCSSNIKITNMFDASVLSSGLDIPAGKTLELVFTFWDVNEVSFNGGLSV